MSLRTMRRRFRQPPAIHAPWLGWTWNGRLDDRRLEQQIDAVARAGFGGVAIYPGPGLLPGIHSSPGWFEHVAAVARKIRRTTVAIHLRESLEGPFATVEDQLCHDHPEVCLTELTVEEIDAPGPPLDDALAGFRVDATTPAAAHRIPALGALTEPSRVTRLAPDAPAPAGRLLVFRTRAIPNRLNYLDRRAAELFLETVPQHLATHAKRALGRTVAGLYIDGIGLRLTPGALPWDPELDTLFRETRGYSLIDALPALFYDVPGHACVRYDYWTIINDMLREGLATPVKEWCQEHKLRFGVSLRPLDRRDPALLETALLPVERVSDDFVLRIPYDVAENGFENPAAFGDWLVAVKRICSHCDQHGEPLRSAVSIGCESPALDLEKAAALGRWLLFLGAQTVIFERMCYRPQRRGDNVCLNDEEAYWPALDSLNAGLARLSGLMRQGRRHVDVAVLYPSASVQALYAHPLHAANPAAPDSPDRTVLKHLEHLAVALHQAGAEFHLVQERTLLELGFADHRYLGAGDHRYRVLIVPPGVNLRGQTIDLLDDFVSGGGALAFAGAVPWLVDGKESEALERLVENYALLLPTRSDLFDYRPVIEFLRRRRFIPRPAEDAPESPVICRRTAEEAELFFAFNPKPDARDLQFTAKIPFDGHLERWDPRTGDMHGVAPCTKDEPLTVADTWAPYEARVYVAMDTAFREPSNGVAMHREPGPAPEWTVSRPGPNALEFAFCELPGDDDPGTVDEARTRLVDALADSGHPVTWHSNWRFQCAEALDGGTLLIPATDADEDGPPTVALDGADLTEFERRSYRGRDYFAADLPQLAAGEHAIDWTATCRTRSDFLSPVILGDFAVESAGSPRPVLASPPDALDFGPWSTFGLADYAGPVVYRGVWTAPDLPKQAHVLLSAPDLRGAAVLKVNGHDAGAIIEAPRERDITRHVKRGENTLEVELAPMPGQPGQAAGLAAPPHLWIAQPRHDAD